MKKKVIKIVSNNPLGFIGEASRYGDCKIVKGSLYVATDKSLKEIKQGLESCGMNMAYRVSIVRDFIPEVLDWIEELVLENCEGEIFFDVFAGTGVVSAHMSKHYKKIIMNDKEAGIVYEEQKD